MCKYLFSYQLVKTENLTETWIDTEINHLAKLTFKQHLLLSTWPK